MLKVSNLTSLRPVLPEVQVGINWDGTIYIRDENSEEYFIHPDDLKPGAYKCAYAQSKAKITLDETDCETIRRVLKESGIKVIGAEVIRMA